MKKVWYPVVNMCTIKPYVTGTNKITKDTVEQTMGQSRSSLRDDQSRSSLRTDQLQSSLCADQSLSNLGAGQSQSSHVPSPAYITCSKSRQAPRTTRTVAEDTPEDAVHNRWQNVELLR